MEDGSLPNISVAPPSPQPTTGTTNPYRLLYRGSLSLPDSLLLLDGLTFTTKTDPSSRSKSSQLLDNSLALALESMRGRPSLRLLGIVELNEDKLSLDSSGGVEVDIHPRAVLTRIYFENVFCLSTPASISSEPFPSASKFHSNTGVKIALGETDGPDTTQIVISARVSEDSADRGSHGLDLIVSRVIPCPPPSLVCAPSVRRPRPDDPTPRRPPVLFHGAGKRKHQRTMTGAGASGSKCTRSALGGSGRGGGTTSHKRQKLCEEGTSEGENKVRGSLFKVPEVPRTGAKESKRRIDITGEGDVFGNGFVVPGKSKSACVGKPETKVDETGMKPGQGVVEMEQANKNVIKQCTLNCLYNTKDPTAPRPDKTHPEFQEVFAWVYRGVKFALRSRMKDRPVEQTLVERLVKTHLEMYVGGYGGPSERDVQV